MQININKINLVNKFFFKIKVLIINKNSLILSI